MVGSFSTMVHDLSSLIDSVKDGSHFMELYLNLIKKYGYSLNIPGLIVWVGISSRKAIVVILKVHRLMVFSSSGKVQHLPTPWTLARSRSGNDVITKAVDVLSCHPILPSMF